MSEPTTFCRSCGAPIRWAKTVDGNRMPVDFDPDPEGNLELRRSGFDLVAVVVTPRPDAVLYRPHFATCPDADEWRNRNR